jgi:hypothetical protein
MIDSGTYKDVRIINKEHVKQIATCMYGTTVKNSKEMSFKELINCSKEVTALANYLPEDFPLRFSSNAKTELKLAFNFTLNVMKEVVDITDLNGGASTKARPSKIGQAILGSAMFFSLLVWDKYSNGESLTAIDYKRIAKNLVEKAAWTNMNLSLLSSKKSMDDAIISFYEIIRTKKQSL